MDAAKLRWPRLARSCWPTLPLPPAQARLLAAGRRGVLSPRAPVPVPRLALPQNVVQADALCTLGAIEEANARVEQLLSEESRERHSVSGARPCRCWAPVPLLRARAAAAHP